jgi:hypothetical protein
VHDGVLRKSSEQAHDTQVFSASMMSRGLIADLLARAQVSTKVTQVLVTSRATHATTTRRNETKYDVIARRKPTYVRANLLHNAGTFVASNHWQFKRQVTCNYVLI